MARSVELMRAAGRMGVTPQFRAWPGLRLNAPPANSNNPSPVEKPTAVVEQSGDWFAADLVVSTLPAGAADPLASSLAGQSLAGKVLLDVAYRPWPTPLAQAWASAGGLVASGLDMLLFQGAEQFRLMTGLPAPIEAMRVALLVST